MSLFCFWAKAWTFSTTYRVALWFWAPAHRAVARQEPRSSFPRAWSQRMKSILIAGILGATLAAFGCDRSKTEERRGEEPAAADNTEKNKRDDKAGALTPGDQGESETDRTITQKVRQGVVGHD